MVFKISFPNPAASLFIFLQNVIGLIFSPYKTVRTISTKTPREAQVAWILAVSVLYFFNTNFIRGGYLGLAGAILLYGGTVVFLAILPGNGTFRERLVRIVATWSYTLVPTCIWFYANLLLYIVLPPPRSISLLGAAFSVFYIAFSVSLLFWKIILAYLCLRFSLRIHLYRIIYYMVLYVALSVPLWILLYRLGISRIPFV